MTSSILTIAFGIFTLFTPIHSQDFYGVCDHERNANLSFCDSSLSYDTRVQDLLSRLTIDELIGLSGHEARGVDGTVVLPPYNWWGEALHGVAWSPAVHFRAPTEFATVFPQVLHLAASFNRDLWLRMANATGNEGRAFHNAGNAGLTFWSPDINIFRDPRWGRGQETPGEDPYLSGEFARVFLEGMQENDKPFLKTSTCCKHFAAYSLEHGRYNFDAVVNARDMADTYFPAFKKCVQQGGATCVMCSYNAINGIPACANRQLMTTVLRDKWGFDGYSVTDCYAIGSLLNDHHYTNNVSDTCKAPYDAGIEIACDDYWQKNLHIPLADGTLNRAVLENALAGGYRVLMRLGYFEKEATRPWKELQPPIVDSQPHRELALEAARQGIVLLKNTPNAKTGQPSLPIQVSQFKSKRLASMALIGPHLDASEVFLGNYNGFPSFIKTPLQEIQRYVPDLEYEYGCGLVSTDNPRLVEAEQLARESTQVVLFVGISSEEVEQEFHDREDLHFPGLQPELIRRVLDASQQSVIMVVVSAGPIDLTEWKNDPRVGAIIQAGYLGQAGGEAIADVLFGIYNPSGRVTHTFYSNDFIGQAEMGDMNVRPNATAGFPGRTYRFYTGEPVYSFGHGLSYTTFQYSWVTVDQLRMNIGGHASFETNADECDLEVMLSVRNSGQRAGDHSILAFLASPDAGQMGRPIKSLAGFERVNVQPNEERQVTLCLSRNSFQLANEDGDFVFVTGAWSLFVGDLQRTIFVSG